MKILLIIIDGLGDKPIPQLGNKTPLEAAKTPNLDWLAKNGICGQILPYLQNKKLPTSEDTHLALFGYQPKIFNPGRGVLEVLGIRTKVLPGDVCLRGNFATVDKNLKIIDRRAGRIEKTAELIRAISGIEIGGLQPSRHPSARGPLVKFLIGKAVSHRIGLVMRGRSLSPIISDNDPKITQVRPVQIRALDKSAKALFTARILNQFLTRTHSILKNLPLNKKRKLPANYILVRGAGKLKKNPSFRQKYKLSSCCIAGGTLYKGIGKFLGMREIKVKGANALPTTNLPGKFQSAKRALKNYDFVFLHIKAADNLAEDGKFLAKKEFIEKIDKNLKPILNLKDTLITVTADHSTCSLLKRHCLEPFPVLLYGRGIKPDRVTEFSERACKKGKLGKIKQIDLMPVILSLAY